MTTLSSFADNLHVLFGSRSGLTKCQARSGSILFDTLMVFLKIFLRKIILKKKLQMTITKHCKELTLITPTGKECPNKKVPNQTALREI